MIIFIRIDPLILEDFKKAIMKEFDITDMRLMSYFLSIEVKFKRFFFLTGNLCKRSSQVI